MVELLRTADQVVLTFAMALLTVSGIDHDVAGEPAGDGARLLVPADRADDARRVLVDIGLLENAPS